MKKNLIIANWKSNPNSENEAVALAGKIEAKASLYKNIETVIAPPFPFLLPVNNVLKKAKLGGQDAFWSSGPYTGEVSWEQLKNLGAEYVIIGHSERKNIVGESDNHINKKVKTLLKNKLKTILCVGEKERIGNEIPEEVGRQLKVFLDGVKSSELDSLVIAYEPVWAISTNPEAKPDTPASAFQAMLYLRKELVSLYGKSAAQNVPIVYGGSVNSGNIKGFLTEGNMEGALVGGASLKPEEFSEILKIASQ